MEFFIVVVTDVFILAERCCPHLGGIYTSFAVGAVLPWRWQQRVLNTLWYRPGYYRITRETFYPTDGRSIFLINSGTDLSIFTVSILWSLGLAIRHRENLRFQLPVRVCVLIPWWTNNFVIYLTTLLVTEE